MVTSALILAGGESTRWGNHLGVKKHLAPVPDEPVIHRLQRELLERAVDDVMVACKAEDVDAYVTVGRAVELADLGDGWRHEWADSRAHWPNNRLLVFYGDCFHTSQLLDAMVSDDAPGWRVYARWGKSSLTMKQYGEMFGWVIQPEAHAVLDEACEVAIRAFRDKKITRVLGWEVYRQAVGFNLTSHSREDNHGVEWNDLSEDFDWPVDYDRWLEGLKRSS